MLTKLLFSLSITLFASEALCTLCQGMAETTVPLSGDANQERDTCLNLCLEEAQTANQDDFQTAMHSIMNQNTDCIATSMNHHASAINIFLANERSPEYIHEHSPKYFSRYSKTAVECLFDAMSAGLSKFFIPELIEKFQKTEHITNDCVVACLKNLSEVE